MDEGGGLVAFEDVGGLLFAFAGADGLEEVAEVVDVFVGEFLDEFAGVTREQARAVIDLAARGQLSGLEMA